MLIDYAKCSNQKELFYKHDGLVHPWHTLVNWRDPPVGLAKRFTETIREEYDNFGLMVDLSHIMQLHETIEEAILPIKDYIVHAHIANCVTKDPAMPAYGDAHPRFGFPNSAVGVDEVVHFLKVLMDIGFISEERCPIVSFEVKPWGDEDPDMVVANAKRVLNLLPVSKLPKPRNTKVLSPNLVQIF